MFGSSDHHEFLGVIFTNDNDDNDNDNDNDNENMFITTDIYSISETNARHKYIGKSIKQ